MRFPRRVRKLFCTRTFPVLSVVSVQTKIARTIVFSGEFTSSRSRFGHMFSLLFRPVHRHRYRSLFDRRLFDHRLLEKITSTFFQPLTCVGVLSLNRYRSQRTKRARCFKNEKKPVNHTRDTSISVR